MPENRRISFLGSFCFTIDHVLFLSSQLFFKCPIYAFEKNRKKEHKNVGHFEKKQKYIFQTLSGAVHNTSRIKGEVNFLKKSKIGIQSHDKGGSRVQIFGWPLNGQIRFSNMIFEKHLGKIFGNFSIFYRILKYSSYYCIKYSV